MPYDEIQQAVIEGKPRLAAKLEQKALACARAMKAGLERLEPYFEGGWFGDHGKAILGTAGGDLHDVGKNIVAIMFRGSGFEVVDLGVDVSARQFVQAVRENPDVKVVCISCLLTTSLPEMKHIVQALNEMSERRDFRVMVGGGPVTGEFARQIGADAYTENAMEAAEIARTFSENVQAQRRGGRKAKKEKTEPPAQIKKKPENPARNDGKPSALRRVFRMARLRGRMVIFL